MNSPLPIPISETRSCLHSRANKLAVVVGEGNEEKEREGGVVNPPFNRAARFEAIVIPFIDARTNCTGHNASPGGGRREGRVRGTPQERRETFDRGYNGKLWDEARV